MFHQRGKMKSACGMAEIALVGSPGRLLAPHPARTDAISDWRIWYPGPGSLWVDEAVRGLLVGLEQFAVDQMPPTRQRRRQISACVR